MKITLIGGNGFIGSHIVDKLVAEGSHTLTVFGRSLNKFASELSEVEYIYGDFENIELLRKALRGSDIVIHLLSTTVPSTADINPAYDIRSNVIGTINLLEEIVKQNIKRFIFVSSGGTVYGNPEYIPINEKHPLNPISSYGIGKVTIESYVKLYSRKYKFSNIIIRPSNPYGPRQNFSGEQGVISTFMHKVLQKEPLEVWGDGSVIRDYIYIDDVVEFFMYVIDGNHQGIFNLGHGSGYSIHDIIKYIEQVTGLKADVRYIESKNTDVKEIILNIKKAEDILGWSPSTSLIKGISKHYNWMYNQLTKEN